MKKEQRNTCLASHIRWMNPASLWGNRCARQSILICRRMLKGGRRKGVPDSPFGWNPNCWSMWFDHAMNHDIWCQLGVTPIIAKLWEGRLRYRDTLYMVKKTQGQGQPSVWTLMPGDFMADPRNSGWIASRRMWNAWNFFKVLSF